MSDGMKLLQAVMGRLRKEEKGDRMGAKKPRIRPTNFCSYKFNGVGPQIIYFGDNNTSNWDTAAAINNLLQ